MGRLKKKGSSGTAINYMTRNQALKKLQITLQDFRRLCILKGVYPRDPKHKKKIAGGSSANATFYLTKDIKHLQHEPILAKFREYKTFAKKMKKLLGKREWDAAKRFEQNKPVYRLDHVIKERYPTFVDALRDLDDALSHVFLFASLPKVNGLTTAISTACQRLCLEFQSYVMATGSLRKAFISIKGIYYQAEVHGQTLTWLVPYQFAQAVPANVDYRVMLTFLELYQTLMAFVNFKLVSELGWPHPVALNKAMLEAGISLPAVQTTDASAKLTADSTLSHPVTPAMAKKLQSLQAKLSEIVRADKEQLAGPAPAASVDVENEADDAAEIDPDAARLASSPTLPQVFAGLVFFVAREVPLDALFFVIRSLGGQVGWGHGAGTGSPFSESDTRITHMIVDRPVQSTLYAGRLYVQPQWAFDCLNARARLDEAAFAPGVSLPPHRSPFVEDEVEMDGEEDELAAQGGVPLTHSVEEAEQRFLSALQTSDYAEGIEAEAKGESPAATSVPIKSSTAAKPVSKKAAAKAEEAERKELALSMMSKKKRKLYEAMQRGLRAKEAEASALKARRRKLKDTGKQTAGN